MASFYGQMGRMPVYPPSVFHGLPLAGGHGEVPKTLPDRSPKKLLWSVSLVLGDRHNTESLGLE
jgi:hypothetical protein